MRIVFEGGASLKYWLVTEANLPELYRRRSAGLAAVMSNDYAWLRRIEYLSGKINLTPWLRRRDTLAAGIRLKDRRDKINSLSASGMRELVRLARTGAADSAPDVRIHALPDRYVVQAMLNDQVASRVIPANAAELRVLLTRLKLRYQRLQVTLLARNLAELTRLHGFGLGCSITYEAERLADLRGGRERPYRDILVLTNIAGAELPQLQQNLDFWSRGLRGYRFRHVFGQLSPRRCEAALAQRNWDMIIYRGHGMVQDQRIAWQLAGGAWPVPEKAAKCYLHLSCLAGAENLGESFLPADRVITPLKHLEDFHDAEFVQALLGRLSSSGNFYRAVRSLQQTRPDFVLIAH